MTSMKHIYNKLYNSTETSEQWTLWGQYKIVPCERVDGLIVKFFFLNGTLISPLY